MTPVAELANLKSVAARIGVRLESEGDAFAIYHAGGGRLPVSSLASAAMLLGALLAVSAEMDADVAVEMARYGIGGGRAQRRADAKTQRRARRAK